MKLGFIGQGWIGKNYADYFESRGFKVVRYSNELSFSQNKEHIKSCNIVFISVPTPTTQQGFDYSIVEEVLPLVGDGNIAVIKSTVVPGTTEKLQQNFPAVFVLHSPEFLSEKTARHDIENPDCNVVGIPVDDKIYRKKAESVLSLLPKVPSIICSSREAELIKYTHNVHGFIQIMYANLLFDLAEKLKVNWDVIKEFIGYDKFMTNRYANPVHASGHTDKKGRGAGGHCFIKDFAAFRGLHQKIVSDEKWTAILKSLENKNIDLLKSSGKDIDILKETYGDDIIK